MGKPMTERERLYVRRNHMRMTQAEMAKRLGRSGSFVFDVAKTEGIEWGVPEGFVRLSDVFDDRDVVRAAARAAKTHGAYFKSPGVRGSHCAREKWVEWYLARRLEWVNNDAIAKREGWYGTREIAELMGCEWKLASVALTTRRGIGWGREFKGVKRLRGTYGRWWFEPGGAELALTRLGVQVHRRAA